MHGKLLLQELRGCPIDLVPGKKVVSINPGEWTSPFEGKGFEPLGYRDFVMGDNPRQLHLPTSARRGVPTIVERVALRDFKLMVVIDVTESMRSRSKAMIQHEAAAIMLYSAWQAETTFALAARSEAGIESFGLGIGSRHFYHLFNILWGLCADFGKFRLKGARLHLRRCLPPNATLVYCSDFLDADGGIERTDELLRAVTRYDFVPVIVQDEFEYGFPVSAQASLLPCTDPETGQRDEYWVSPGTAKRIRSLHERRFAQLVERFRKRNIRPVHLSAPGVGEAQGAINDYFRRRRRRSS